MDKLFAWCNVHKSPFTTLLGVVIILASVVSVFSHGRSWSEAAAGCAIGSGLCGLKDPPAGAATETGVVGGLLLFLLLGVGGCVSQKKLLAKYGTQNPPQTIELSDTLRLPVTLRTKPDSLHFRLGLDSLATAPAGDTLKLVSKGSQAVVKLWTAGQGHARQLQGRVDVPARVVHDTITKVVTLYGKCPPTYTIQPTPKPGFFKRAWLHYQSFCTALVSIALIVALILLGFRLGLFRFLKFLPFVVVVGCLASCSAQRAAQPKYRPSALYQQHRK